MNVRLVCMLLCLCSHSYGFFKHICFYTDFCTDFFKNTGFWTFVRFLKETIFIGFTH